MLTINDLCQKWTGKDGEPLTPAYIRRLATAGRIVDASNEPVVKIGRDWIFPDQVFLLPSRRKARSKKP